MGYTVYFDTKPGLDAKKFETFSEQVKQIIGEAEVLGIKIVNDMGDADTDPIISKEIISFNGEGSEACEDFTIYRVGKNLLPWCKTNRNPYDLIVKATVVMLKHNFPESIIKVDGTIFDFDAAIKLCEKLFGKVNFELY